MKILRLETENVKAEWNRKTIQLKEIESQKSEQLAQAKFPVPGLSFDNSGVVFNSQPFAQASSAEKLRVSVSMGIAMNPELKIILIRDASLLDAENMETLKGMAEVSDCQLWIERVGTGSECSVIIEDGSIKGSEDA